MRHLLIFQNNAFKTMGKVSSKEKALPSCGDLQTPLLTEDFIKRLKKEDLPKRDTNTTPLFDVLIKCWDVLTAGDSILTPAPHPI
jgi:hypothetical protein